MQTQVRPARTTERLTSARTATRPPSASVPAMPTITGKPHHIEAVTVMLRGLLPKSVLQLLAKSNCRIDLVEGRNLYYDPRAEGLSPSIGLALDRTAVIAVGSGWVGGALLHEVGHLVDRLLIDGTSAGRTSATDAWQRAHSAAQWYEGLGFSRDPEAASASEFFAESFRRYFSGERVHDEANTFLRRLFGPL